MALIDCGNSYINDTAVITMLLMSLMKLTKVEMTTKHAEIKDFMLKLESSNDYFINKVASGTSVLY